jgi:hypothetical protein
VRPHLLYSNDEFPAGPPPAHRWQWLVADLGLGEVFDAMSGGDQYLHSVASAVVLTSLTQPTDIAYRQAVLSDCLAATETIGQIYELAGVAIAEEKKIWSVFTNVPRGRLHRAVKVLALFSGHLRTLRQIADSSIGVMQSEGLKSLMKAIQTELTDSYLDEMAHHLDLLELRSGVLASARPGPGGTSSDWRIHLSAEPALNWWRRLLLMVRKSDSLRLVAGPGDDRADLLQGEALDEAAAALAGAMSHVLSFFTSLRFELAFYLGAVNLYRRLEDKGEATCLPTPGSASDGVWQACGLYDVGLALLSDAVLVGNDLEADGRSLLLITGANQGGKSTFLRALGLAQMLMQSGLFVPARSFSAPVRQGVLTHYKQEEDSGSGLGKLEEELARMSQVLDGLRPGSLVLLNESFSSTNETEGAAIASGLIEGLLEAGVAVACVTHSFELADYFVRGGRDEVTFLQAERREDGSRSFRLLPAPPSPTSHAEDLYREVFGRQVAGTAPATSKRLGHSGGG